MRLSSAKDGRAAQHIARWRHAEERLYPIVMADPEQYRAIVSVVRAVADLLTSETTVDRLIDARARGREMVSQAADTAGITVGQLGDVELVADAAFHLRHRELLRQQRRREVTGTIAAARARSDTWVVLAESGNPDQPGTQPYERVEMRVDDGWAIRGWIDVDPDSFAPVYGFARLRLDPESGDVVAAEEPAEPRTCTTREQWDAAWISWRDRAPR